MLSKDDRKKRVQCVRTIRVSEVLFADLPGNKPRIDWDFGKLTLGKEVLAHINEERTSFHWFMPRVVRALGKPCDYADIEAIYKRSDEAFSASRS